MCLIPLKHLFYALSENSRENFYWKLPWNFWVRPKNNGELASKFGWAGPKNWFGLGFKNQKNPADMMSWFSFWFSKICYIFIWLALIGTLMSIGQSRFSAKSFLTLRHIELKPTHLVAIIVNQGWCFDICVKRSCNRNIA